MGEWNAKARANRVNEQSSSVGYLLIRSVVHWVEYNCLILGPPTVTAAILVLSTKQSQSNNIIGTDLQLLEGRTLQLDNKISFTRNYQPLRKALIWQPVLMIYYQWMWSHGQHKVQAMMQEVTELSYWRKSWTGWGRRLTVGSETRASTAATCWNTRTRTRSTC